MAEGRAGGVGSRGVGGGFDGNPAGPSRDGANDDHDPSDRNRPRGFGFRNKLPAEFADFRLADGRTLREVMGDRFFGSARRHGRGKFLSRRVRDRLEQGAPGTEPSLPPAVQLSRRADFAERRAAAGAQAADRQARLAAARAARRAPGSFGGRL